MASFNGPLLFLATGVTAEYILALILITLLLWRLYWCCYLRLHGDSYADDDIAQPPAPAHSPLHTALIHLLPASTYSSAKVGKHSHPPPECAICLIEFKEGDIGRALPSCDHFFHVNCVDEWLQTNKTCPMCRSVVHPPPRRITSSHGNTKVSAGGVGQFENSSNVNLPQAIWCSRNTQPIIELEEVVIEIPDEDDRRRKRQSSDSVNGRPVLLHC